MHYIKFKYLLCFFLIFIPLSLFGCSKENNEEIIEEDFDLGFSISSLDNTHVTNIDEPLKINNQSNSFVKCSVSRVIDGDTVELILPNGEKISTRLLLIDTPETKHPKLGAQEYGKEASEFAKSVLSTGDEVYLEFDEGSKTDKYNRYLGYIWYTCDEHNSLELYNERVIEEGLARVGYIYSQTKHLDGLLETETIAKNKDLNIWSIDGYVTDNGYDMTKINDIDKDIDDNFNSNENNNLVYANEGSSSSNLFHKNSNSHNMKDPLKLDKQQAIKKGYLPCSVCFR